MLKNYLKIALRNLWRNKIYAFINIFGLALAVATCVIAYLNYQYELNFDKFHQNADRVYKINALRTLQGGMQEGVSISPSPLANAIKSNSEDIRRVARLVRRSVHLKLNNNFFEESLSYADRDFQEMFSFPLKWGSKKSFANPNTIFFTEELSKKLYGGANPTGNIIEVKVNGKIHSFIVGGVFQKIPKNSSLQLEALTLFDNYLTHFDLKANDWSNWVDGTFVEVKNISQVSALNQRIQTYVNIQNQNDKSLQIKSFYLEPLVNMTKSEHHLYKSNFNGGLADSAIIGMISSALSILLLACFNFINTSIAFSSNRLKEIGIRKTIGGTRQELLKQFLLENFILLGLAIFGGMLLAELLIPAYNALFPFMFLELNYSQNAALWLFLVVLWVVMGILAGIYPAWYLSSFQPINILRDRTKFGGVSNFTRFLLVVQLAITVYHLTFSLSFYQNALYQETLDKGYDMDRIFVIPLKKQENLQAFRDALASNPNILGITGSQEQLGVYLSDYTIQYQLKTYPVGILEVGKDYAKTVGLVIEQGEDLQSLEETDAYKFVLVNQKLVNDLDLKNPIGQSLKIDQQQFKIKGVVRDFHEKTVMKGEKTRPVVIKLTNPANFHYLSLRTHPENMATLKAQIKQNWQKFYPEEPFAGFYQSEVMRHVQFVNDIIITVDLYFTFIALLISLLSLYTLLSLSILKRIKEIGIRKILGADLKDIMILISQNYFWLLMLASVIGIVVGYFVLEILLDIIYDYRMPISWWNLLIPVLIMVGMAAITLGYKIYATSMLNPVDVLKNE